MRLLSSILLFVLFNGFTFVKGRVLSSHQLAVGEWNVTLRGGWLFDPTNIFPNTPGIKLKRRPWGSTLDCTCSLCDDGTFCLKPLNKENSNEPLMIRGEWEILSNPYCITDRFYDQITMKSYPRKEISLAGGKTLRSLQFSFHCRMWGRYSKGTIRTRRGRMTHGTLVAATLPSKEDGTILLPWWKRFRPISASFSAFRNSYEPSQEGWADKTYFGY